MSKYIGVKVLEKAVLMTKKMYCDIRGWDVPTDEDPEELVYLVEYEDGKDNKPNVEGYRGYVSMSPKKVFENAYRKIDAMTFGLATETAKKGYGIARRGWNGSGMFAFIEPEYQTTVRDILDWEIELGTGVLRKFYVPQFAHTKSEEDAGKGPGSVEVTYRTTWKLRTADGSIATWAPSGSDSLAEDWYITH